MLCVLDFCFLSDLGISLVMSSTELLILKQKTIVKTGGVVFSYGDWDKYGTVV